MTTLLNTENPARSLGIQEQAQPLKDSVATAMQNYFTQLGDQAPSDIYEMVLAEVEVPLLNVVMEYCRGNQSKAARVLGISRGTLRKKLKIYDLD